MPEIEVADSTDWLSTPLAGLTAVESALRCQVCKDFYNTPMITSCSHTFCSLCIRRALSNENKCPLCRGNEQEIKLRSNWAMEEAVQSFKEVRTSVLNLARTSGASKRKAEVVTEPSIVVAPAAKRLRSSRRLRNDDPVNYNNKSWEEAEEPIAIDDDVVVQSQHEDEDGDGNYTPDTADGLVPCPMCQIRMKEWQVFSHIENCSGPTPEKKTPDRTINTQLGTGQLQQNKAIERLPPLNYSMLKEAALRKKLGELGISNQGPRTMLEKRHKEWITLWNANCDAVRPKRRSELTQDLETWERTQGLRAAGNRSEQQNAQAIAAKDFDGSAWATTHGDSFKDLIASARKSRQAVTTNGDSKPDDQDEEKDLDEEYPFLKGLYDYDGPSAQNTNLQPGAETAQRTKEGPHSEISQLSMPPPEPVQAGQSYHSGSREPGG